MSDGMATTVRTLADAEAEIRDLRDQLRDAEEELRLAEEELANWEATVWPEDSEDEIKTIREFIADVRRGIRDLSEYEDVCGP